MRSKNGSVVWLRGSRIGTMPAGVHHTIIVCWSFLDCHSAALRTINPRYRTTSLIALLFYRARRQCETMTARIRQEPAKTCRPGLSKSLSKVRILARTPYQRMSQSCRSISAVTASESAYSFGGSGSCRTLRHLRDHASAIDAAAQPPKVLDDILDLGLDGIGVGCVEGGRDTFGAGCLDVLLGRHQAAFAEIEEGQRGAFLGQNDGAGMAYSRSSLLSPSACRADNRWKAPRL
jgi:hypothetical protein